MLKKIIRDNKLTDFVEFAGVVENINSYLDKASLVVVPSLSEPFGRVIIEAMARKKIVIGTKVGGIPEIISQYNNGFLVSPANSVEIAKTILYVWSKSEEQKSVLKEKAYLTVKENYTPDMYVNNIVKVYKKLFDRVENVKEDWDVSYWRRNNGGPVKDSVILK